MSFQRQYITSLYWPSFVVNRFKKKKTKLGKIIIHHSVRLTDAI